MAKVTADIIIFHEGEGRIVRKNQRKSTKIETHVIELSAFLGGYQICLCPEKDEYNFASAELTREEVKFMIRSLKNLIGEE